MKITIFYDGKSDTGGNYYLSLNKIIQIHKLNIKNLDIECLVINEEVKEDLLKRNFKVKILKITYFKKILFYLSNIAFFEKILKFISFHNPLTNILKKGGTDLVIFISPSGFVNYCKDINFIYEIWETQHKDISFFPEYNNKKISTTFETREKSYNFAVNKAFKIVVDTNSSKNDLMRYYNCDPRKIEIQPFIPYLIHYYQITKKNYKEIFDNLKIEKSKYVFFYPAQFWPHKNHRYILDGLKILKEKFKVVDFKMIFCGKDKLNKKFIQELVKSNKLEKNITILDFIDIDQVISLYLNSSALIMPTYVGRSSLPLRESFFFKLPVFYTLNLLDKSYSDYVYEIDINNPEDIANKINKYINEGRDQEKLDNAKKFLLKSSNEQLIIDSYKKILNDYKYISSRWLKN